MKLVAKIIGYTIVFLAIFVVWYSVLQKQHWGWSNVAMHGRIDDRDRDIPFFRVMSNVDTSDIDPLIEIYYQDILENNEAFNSVSDDEYSRRIYWVCEYYDDICNRMILNSTFSMREIYMFTIFSIYSISQIDANMKLENVWSLRETISNIYFEKNAEDIVRWKAGHRNLSINTYDMRTTAELFEVLVHELMHVLDLGVIDDSYSTTLNQDYKEFGDPYFGIRDWSLRFYSISWETDLTKRNSARNDHIISGYGHTNIFEEFAEFGNAWLNHHVPLLSIAREDPIMLKKYLLFKELFGERFFNKDIDTYKNKSLDEKPWDTTRRQETVSDK